MTTDSLNYEGKTITEILMKFQIVFVNMSVILVKYCGKDLIIPQNTMPIIFKQNRKRIHIQCSIVLPI